MFLCSVLVWICLQTINYARFSVFNEWSNNLSSTTWKDQLSGSFLDFCQKDQNTYCLGKQKSTTNIYWQKTYSLPLSTRLDIYIEFQVSGVWNNDMLKVYGNNILMKSLSISLTDSDRYCNTNFMYESSMYLVMVGNVNSLQLTIKSFGTNQGLYIQNIVINQRTQSGRNNIIPFYYDIITCTGGSGLQFQQYYCQCFSPKVFQINECKAQCDQDYLYDPTVNECYKKSNCDGCVGKNSIIQCNPGTYKFVGSNTQETNCVIKCPLDYYQDQTTMTCIEMSLYLQQKENNGCKFLIKIDPVTHYFFYKNSADFFHFFQYNSFQIFIRSIPFKMKERSFVYKNGIFVAGSYEKFQSQILELQVEAEFPQHKLRLIAIGHFIDFSPLKNDVYINEMLQPSSQIKTTIANEQKTDQDYITYYDYTWTRTEDVPVTYNKIMFKIEQPLQNGQYQGYFYLEDIHLYAYHCQPTCNSCFTITSCTPCTNPTNKNPLDCTCQNGFVKQGDSCIACPTYCSFCTVIGICDDCLASTKRLNPPDCNTCPEQFYIQTYYDNCQPCKLGCRICTTQSYCINCLSGYYKNSDSQCITQCSDGYFNDNTDTTDPACSLCSNNCLKCENLATKCTGCKDSATLISNHCYSCNDGFYLSGITCLPCITNCQKCQGLTCFKCFETYFLQSSNGQCVSICEAGTFGNSFTRTCDLCHVTCSTCLNGTENDCLNCPKGKILNVQNTLSGNCQQNCLIKYYRIDYFCAKCWKGCATCIDPTPACLTCAPKYYRYQTNGFCYEQCPDGFYNNKMNSFCSSCHSICKTCFSNTDQSCLSCQLPLALFSAKCLDNCPEGYGNVNGICLSCTPNCKQCFGILPNQCAKCYSGFYFLKNQCYYKCPTSFVGIRPQYVCKCIYDNCVSCTATQFFFNNVCYDVCPQETFGFNGLCLQCDISCQTCFGVDDNSCLSCAVPQILDKTECVNECVGKKYHNIQKNECVPCDYSCLACNGPNNNNCTACYETFLITEDGTCVESCSDEEYLVISEQKCYKCHPSCLTCFGGSQNNCLTCVNLFYLHQCVNSCPDGFRISDNLITCEPDFAIVIDQCAYQCTTCQLVPRFCTECSANRLQNPPYCDCEFGYYDDGSNAQCKLCNNKCSACVSFNNCLTCKGDRELPHCNCPKYYYDDYISLYCNKCPDNCETCNASGCLTCLKNRINPSQCICPDGYYEAYTLYCQECASKCRTCSVSEIYCDSCSSFRENPPICNCPKGYFENSDENCQQCSPVCVECNSFGCLSCFGNRIGPDDGLCTCPIPGASRLSIGSVYCTDCHLGVPYFGLTDDFTGFYFDFGVQVSIVPDEMNSDLCSQFFEIETLQQLGTSPKCNSNLTVFFGDFPTIQVGDLIQLKSQFMLLGCTTKFANVLSMPLKIPSIININTHKPIIKFKQLNSPNICTPIAIEFENKLYNGNQHFQVLTWNIILPTQTDPQVADILQANIANNSEVILFPTKILEAKLLHKFAITVKSFAQIINTIIIEFIPVAYSTIIFEATTLQNQFHRYENIIIPFKISYYNCIEDNPPSQSLFYAIQLQNNQNQLLHGTITEGLLDGFEYKVQLEFNSYYFNFTNPYTLVLTTLLTRADYNVQTSNTFDIFIISTPPILNIEGGNRMIGFANNLYLNSTITDEDLSLEETKNLNYTCYWQCNDIVNGTNCLDQFNQIIIFENNCSIVVKGKTFAPYQVFLFSVSIIKNSIPYSTKVSIQVIELDLPTLNVIGVDQTQTYNYYDELIYYLIYPGVNPDLIMYAGALIYDQSTQATFQFYYLEVKFKLLNYFTQLTQHLGTQARLRLSIYDPRFIMPSLNTQILIMNIPPSNCQVQYDKVNSFVEFLDTINLTILGCQDENLPLKYSVQFYPNYTIYQSDLVESNFYNYILIEPPQHQNNFKFSLPYLNNATSYLVIIIQDSNGGITNLTSRINVKKFENIDEDTIINYKNRQLTLNQHLIGYRVIAERFQYINAMNILKETLFQELIFFDKNQSFLSNQTDSLYHSISILAGQNSYILQTNETTLLTQLNYRLTLASQALLNLDYYQKNNIMTSSQNIQKIYYTQQIYSFANILSSFIKYRVSSNRSASDIQDQLTIIIQKLQDISIANEPLYKVNSNSANLHFGYLTSKITQNIIGTTLQNEKSGENSNDIVDYNSSTTFYKYSQTRYLDNPYYTSEGFPKNSSGYQAVDPKIESQNSTSQNETISSSMKFSFPNVKELAANTSLKCIAKMNSQEWSADICKAAKDKGNIVCECKQLNPTTLMESLDYVLDKAAQIYSFDTLLAFASFPFYQTVVFYFYLSITSTYLIIIFWGMKVDNVMFQKLQDEQNLIENLKNDPPKSEQKSNRTLEQHEENIDKQIFTRTMFKQASSRVMQIAHPNSLIAVENMQINQQNLNNLENQQKILKSPRSQFEDFEGNSNNLDQKFTSPPQVIYEDFPLMKLKQLPKQHDQTEDQSEEKETIKASEERISKIKAYFEYLKFFHQILSLVYKDDEKQPRALRATIVYTSIMGSLSVLFVFNQPNNLSLTLVLALITAPLNKIYQILLEKLLTNKRKVIRSVGGGIMVIVAGAISYTMLAGLVLSGSIETANKWSYIFISTFSLDNLLYSPIQLVLQYCVHIGVIKFPTLQQILQKLLDEKGKEILKQIMIKTGLV